MTTDDHLTLAWTTQPGGRTIVLRRLLAGAAVLGVVALAATAFVYRASWLGDGSPGPDPSGSTDARIGSAQLTPASLSPSAPDDPVPTDRSRSGGEVVTVPPETDGPTVGGPSTTRQTARFVPGPGQRLLDTRGEGGVPPPAPDSAQRLDVDPAVSAVALSVSIMATERSGSVLVDGQAGTVEAIVVGGPGARTTNLVLVPVVGGNLTIRSTAGGHLVVDLVGTFEPSGATAAGRFVALDPIEIARLETAVDGRELDLAFSSGGGVPFDRAAAILVSIEADVGRDGGLIQIGPEADAYDQVLMWGPGDPEDPLRRGLVLLEPSPDQIGFLRYDGGSELTVEVIGYFTNDRAETSTAGLFVPTGPRLLVDGPIGPDAPLDLVLDDVPAAVAVLTVGSTTGAPGQLGTIVVPVTGAQATYRPPFEIDAVATLLGVFLS